MKKILNELHSLNLTMRKEVKDNNVKRNFFELSDKEQDEFIEECVVMVQNIKILSNKLK